jgi:hypothetical protein
LPQGVGTIFADGQERFPAALGPPGSHLQRFVDDLRRRGQCRTFVEDHGDVRPEVGLYFDGSLWRQHVRAAIQVRAEFDPPLIYLAPVRQAEDLIAAAIGEDWLVPTDELVQAASTGNQLIAGPEHQVIGIAQNDLRINFLEMLRGQGLDDALGSHRHERRRIDGAVSRLERTPPSGSIGVGQSEQNKWSRPLIIVE